MEYFQSQVRCFGNSRLAGRLGKLLVLVSVLVVGACETIVDLDFPEQPPKIAVNSIFWPDATFEVQISEARSVRDQAVLPTIHNAQVELFQHGALLETLPHAGDGIYRSRASRPVAGEEYELHVSAPGFESIVARDMVPEPVSITFDYNADQSRTADHIKLTIELQDPPESENYYRLLTAYRYEGPNGLSIDLTGFRTDNDALVTENIDPFEDGSDNQSFFRFAFFTDELLDTGVHKIPIEVPAPEYIEGWFASVEVSVDVISKPFYEYATTYRKFETFRDNPFKEPVLVANNVEHGFGLFAGFNRTQFSVDF